jgi:hypothetical protein
MSSLMPPATKDW